MDYLSVQRMRNMGIPDDQIGSYPPGKLHATFLPDERTGAATMCSGPHPRFGDFQSGPIGYTAG